MPVTPEDRRLAAALVGKIADLDACLALAAIAAGDDPDKDYLYKLCLRLWERRGAGELPGYDFGGITWFILKACLNGPLCYNGVVAVNTLHAKYLKDSSDA